MSDTPEKPTPSFDEMAESKPAPTPAAEQPASPPPPAKPAPKPVVIAKDPEPVKPAAPVADPSITFDDSEDGSDGISIPALVVDAVAAAIAIAFTVLLLQDVLPFIN